jgi:hypothetical protein
MVGDGFGGPTYDAGQHIEGFESGLQVPNIVADVKNGLWILQLTDPERVPAFYGFSPEVKPMVNAHKATDGPALALSKPLDRDRAVDETGHQVSIFGRIGSRPFNLDEMQRFYLTKDKKIYRVRDQ